MFLTNSRQAYIDHVAADPDATREKRGTALNHLIGRLEEKAKENKVLLVTALAKLPAMRRRFDGHGYTCYGDYGLYFKVLGD